VLETNIFTYSRLYVSNPNPKFTPPPQKKQRPAFIRAALKQAESVDVARSELFYTLQPINPVTLTPVRRERRMNEHRAKAIRALVQACIFHMNIVTGMVQATVTALSDECGLTSKSKAGNASVSRCCRAILHLEQYGILRCDKVWDKTLGMWIPKMIWVTELFFVMIGLERGKHEAAQRQQLAWVNQGLMKDGEEPISITEAKRRAKELHIKRAFEHRQRQHLVKKQHRKAIKLMAQEEVKARSQILTELVTRYSREELQEMGHEGLKKQVDILYYQLRKLAQSPPDLPIH
jgi:incFII family plasmid replication initiator RepA